MYICHECGRDNSNNIPKAQLGEKVVAESTGVYKKPFNEKELKNIIKDEVEYKRTGTLKKPRAEANKFEKYLPTKETVDFFKNLKKDNTSAVFREALKIQHERGNPSINVGTDKGLPFANKRNYNPFTNEVNIPKSEYRGNIDNYIQEVSHAGQPISEVIPRFLTNDIPGYIKAYTSEGDIDDNIKKYVYNNPNAVENYTHKKIQPELNKRIDRVYSFPMTKEEEEEYLDLMLKYDMPKQKNGGWMDNYNDSKASAPEGMVGDGYSNVGRNYSPAWGGQFQEGGEIPMAQDGRATRADSLFLLKNNKIIKDLQKKGYTWDSKSAISKNPNLWKKIYDTEVKGLPKLIKEDIRKKQKTKPYSTYIDKRGKFVGTQDWLELGGEDYFMPKQYIHPDIIPQYSADLKVRNKSKDHAISSYGYDDLAVTPFDMLTPEQKKERVKLYGTDGVPKSYLDKIKPPDKQDKTDKQRPKVEALQPLTQQGVVSDFNITAQLPVIRPEARMPKSYDVNSQRQTMSGPSEYYNYSDEGVDISDAVRAKESADAYNQYVQEKYEEAAKTNPKAQKRLEQLMQNVELTPNYQMGGNVYPVNYVPQAQGGMSMPGATGSMYARVGAPSNGPYAKKTMASAKNGGWLDGYEKAQDGTQVKYGTPEYTEAYNKGEVVTDEGVRSPIALDEVVIQNNYRRPRGFWEQYADKIVEENKDAGLLGAIIGTPISAITSLPQLAATYGITGEMQRPSETMDIENPYGAMAVDVVTDPANLVGAGILTKEKALARLAASKESGLLSNAYKLNPNAERLNNINKSYRVAGLDALEDFNNTGVLRSQRILPENPTFLDRMKARPTSFPSFQKGYADLRYLPEEGGVVFETGLPTFKRGQINPVTGKVIDGRHYAHRVIDPETGRVMTEIPGSNINVYGDKPHWWKGYQQLDLPGRKYFEGPLPIIPRNNMIQSPAIDSALEKELRPYISRIGEPSISREEEVFRNVMGHEYRDAKELENTIHFDSNGNIISNPDIKKPNLIKKDLSEGNNIKHEYFNNSGNKVATFSGTKDSKGYYVNSINVEPQFRRKGIASDIYKNIAKDLQSKNEGTLLSRSTQHQFTDKDELGRSIAPANKLWENLVNKGEAEKFIEGMSHSYKIKPLEDGGVIKDDMGYWNPENWDSPVEIGSNEITMKRVPFDVLGISDEGDVKHMKANNPTNYKYKGKKVTEFRMAQNGLRQEQKGLVNLDNLTNFTNYNKPQPGGWLNKYN
jgi:hypothetical protein